MSARGDSHLVVRRWQPEDGVTGITSLLHRAYAKQIAMGLRPLAGRQDDDVTQRRLTSGESYVALLENRAAQGPAQPTPRPGGLPRGGGEEKTGRIVGVIILNEQEPDEGPAWFLRPDVISFSQFAVDPDVQARGIGRALLETIEARAAELGKAELALSMAEPDHDLRDYYLKRGFRIVGIWKWPYTNYNSLIMSKRLAVS